MENIQWSILEKKSMTISFTFDEFRDFCITNYVLEHFSKEDVFMQFWKGMRENNLTIREGVQKYVFYLSRTKYQKDLGPIVEKVPEYDELYWLYIWGVQDDYLSFEDVAKWKEQVLQHGSYGRRVVNYLLMRYDCDCFHRREQCTEYGTVLDQNVSRADDTESFHKGKDSGTRTQPAFPLWGKER